MINAEMPKWDMLCVGGFVDNCLSNKQRQELMDSKNKIWPSKFSDDEKRQLLEAADLGLYFSRLANERMQSDLSPAEQRNKLNDAATAIKEAKKHLRLLSGVSLRHADMAFLNARLLTNPEFELHKKDDCGGHIDSLLGQTWLSLDDTERVLNSAAERICVSDGHRPTNHVNDGVVHHIAMYWQAKTRNYPPPSRTGWFAKFIQELGTVVGLDLGLAMAGRCIKNMRQIDEKIKLEINESTVNPANIR